MTAAVEHRLVGYDKRTERVAVEHAIPVARMPVVKKIARVPRDDPQAVHCYALDRSQARDIAGELGVKLNLDRCDYFLEGFAPAQPVAGAAAAEAAPGSEGRPRATLPALRRPGYLPRPFACRNSVATSFSSSARISRAGVGGWRGAPMTHTGQHGCGQSGKIFRVCLAFATTRSPTRTRRIMSCSWSTLGSAEPRIRLRSNITL